MVAGFNWAVACRNGIISFWHSRFFILKERWLHKRLEIGRSVTFLVPVRGGGRGSVKIGDGNHFGFPPSPRLGSGEILIQARRRDSEVTIGNGNWFNNNVTVIANGKITIGNGCQIGDLVAIYDCDFHELNPATRNHSPGPIRPVSIGNNVWLGSRAMILKGVTVGDNSVVAAMSVVNKDVPPNCVVAGVPAKIIRHLQ